MGFPISAERALLSPHCPLDDLLASPLLGQPVSLAH